MYYYSNCLIEAIKAKICLGWQGKIIFISPFKNDSKGSNFLWTDGMQLYDFYPANSIQHWWSKLWFKGYIRQRPYEVYTRWVQTKTWS